MSECAAELGVTTETIRKDILHLEGIGVATKRFGGAVISDKFAEQRAAMTDRTIPGTYADAKSAIAARAIELVPDGASVLIDGGTTTRALGELLALRSGLKIFTNSNPLIGTLSLSSNEIFVIGGRLLTPMMSNVGSWAVRAARSMNVDIAFLGTEGHRGAPGPTSASYDESEFKGTAIAASRKAVVLTDSSKFAASGLFAFSKWSDIDVVVTDDAISEEDYDRLATETTVMVANVSGGGD